MITNIDDAFSSGKKFPNDSEKERLRRWEQNQLLYDCYHDRVFPALQQYMIEQNSNYGILFDFPRLLSNRFADLLLGEPMRITAGKTESAEQKALDTLIEDNDFNGVCREVALDVSTFGIGYFKLRYDGRAIIEAVNPKMVYPIVNPANVRDVKAYVIAYAYSVPAPTYWNKDAKDKYLSVEIHQKGEIAERVYKLKDNIIDSSAGAERRICIYKRHDCGEVQGKEYSLFV